VPVVALGSVRSCGVTTAAAGLAMLWPKGRPRALVEADPAGGALAAVVGLAPEPGLVSLAAAARRGADPALVFEHSRQLANGTLALYAPPGADRAGPALAMASTILARLGELDFDSLLDCGRLGGAGPNGGLFEQADQRLLLSRPRLPDLSTLAAFLESRAPMAGRPSLVLVGPGPYRAAEVTDAFGLEVLAHLPWGSEVAEIIPAGVPASRSHARAPLVRALRSLAEELARRCAAVRVEAVRVGAGEEEEPVGVPA